MGEQIGELLTGIEALSKAADGVKSDDLSGLAKMHGYCESIAEAVAEEGSAADGLKDRLGKMVGTLEALILGDAEDAAASLKTIVEDVAALSEQAALFSGATVTPPAESTSSPVDSSENEPAVGTAASAQPAEPSGAPDNRSLTVAARIDASEADDTGAAECQPPYESQPLRIDPGELEFLKGFVEEAYEHIENVEAAVLEVEQDASDMTRIDDLFRPFHTIKGMAGFLNLRDVNCLTHEVETLLDLGRKGKRAINSDTIDLVFEVVDVLKAQVAEISTYIDKPDGSVVPQPPVEELIARLRVVIASPAEPVSADAPAATTPSDDSSSDAGDAVEPTSSAAPAAAKEKAATSSEPVVSTPVAETEAAAKPASDAKRQAPAKPAQSKVRSQVVTSERSVRIDTSKLDAMVDMVGELVIAQTLVTGNHQIISDPKTIRDVTQVTKIIRDIQAVSMGMRMVPIGPTFQKMARLVRDVARKAGKTIELHISGEDTELDKNVIEQIGDPLVHMIRNACDHGVESPEQRREAEKPPVGNVWLRAAHQGGNIVIEIQDDGKGLDPQKLIKKAIERGVVQQGQELTDQQAYQLIFHPGFSLAAEVTDISGRGVGMDVVKRDLEQLRGTVDITSEVGKGTTFSIRLPLTLAIIDGMIVRVGTERFIIPTISIEKSLRPLREQITTVQGRSEILNVRGRLIPLIQLGELFKLTGYVDSCETMVVIAECEGNSVGLVVEELIGQQQVVIKTLGERFEKLRGISGAAILGDGRVGLILEMIGLVAAHNDNRTYSKLSDGRKNDASLEGDSSADAGDDVERGQSVTSVDTPAEANETAAAASA